MQHIKVTERCNTEDTHKKTITVRSRQVHSREQNANLVGTFLYRVTRNLSVPRGVI
uniref:Uncharacterized protein n=1 Tax=Anguilla anguilla TaxID=7936 RepID=A0A0E9WCF2_ANGAN